jgi:uncharacterized membrane protein YheB (UPF0754 family)
VKNDTLTRFYLLMMVTILGGILGMLIGINQTLSEILAAVR